MTDYKEILRLKNLGFSNNEVAAAVRCGRNTVSRTLKRAEKHSLTWHEAKDMGVEAIRARLFPIGERKLKSYAGSKRIARKSDWITFDMPAQNETFVLQRSFSEEQMATLRSGNIPKAMEDKWFWYMEGNTLYAHRSWTGFCAYIIEFSSDGNNKVTLNRDPSQRTYTSVEEDRKTLNELLNWWSGTSYDYYREWLSETFNALPVSHEEKNHQLFPMQKTMLDLFLECGAITQVQHDKSLHDLREKMDETD